MAYVVCQTHSCQQTYPMEFFGVITKETKNVRCEKCGGVLIDSEGRATFSQNATVIPVISIEELEKQKMNRLKDKRKALKQLEKEISELEKDSVSSDADTVSHEIGLKSLINHTLHVFPKSFINHAGELILEPKNNVYFILKGIETELEFKCKLLAWVSRPIAKGLTKHWSSKLLTSVNSLLHTSFTKEDMRRIYTHLGGDEGNRPLAIQFIESNYDLSLLNTSNK